MLHLFRHTGLILTFWGAAIFPALASDVTMAIADSKPPYIIADTNNGIEVDIARDALALAGHRLVPVFFPQKRIVLEYGRGTVEAAMTVHEGFGLQGFLSDVTISYQNHAIFLEQRRLRINTLQDLAGLTIIAFPNAQIYLGKDYADIATHAPEYREIPNQSLQARILFAGRADIAIADKRIFQYFAAQVKGNFDRHQPLTFAPVFPPSPYRNIFRDEKIRDDFNDGLRLLRHNGDYARILAKYDVNGTD